MGRGEFITSVSGTILCMWFSLWLVEKNVKCYGVLKSLGDASMDIYILSDPVQTVSRLALWNILHMPNVLVIMLCFVSGTGIYCSKVYSAQIQSISNSAVWRMLVHSYL